MQPSPAPDLQTRSGGRILVDTLKNHGVTTAFCVAGESYLDVLDAFHDTPEIKLVTCRQEGGAAFMAEAHGKLTGKPGICLVTRGPGACNAAIGVHTAMQDSTPMILLVGQVARDQITREAFQEIDYRRMFAPPVTKWAEQIDQAARIPEILARAFRIAMEGRPGPVVLALPEDMLCEQVFASDVPPLKLSGSPPAADDLAALNTLLEKSENPVALLGGSGWTDQAVQDFEQIAAKLNLPVTTGFRRQDAFSTAHDSFIGELGTGANPDLVARVKQADLLLAVGTRLSEIVTQGYTLLQAPNPQQTLVHIHSSAAEIGKVYTPALGIAANTEAFCAAWKKNLPQTNPVWKQQTQQARTQYLDWATIKETDKFPLDMDYIFSVLQKRLPKDVIFTTDAGNFSVWAQRYLPYGRPGRLLAPTSGAMGYGFPAALAAAIAHPDRIVIGMAGDGGIMMNGQELASAVQQKAAPVMLVFDNGIYGTIRTHQEKRYPGRVSATDLLNPDFAAWAQSFGANGFAVHENKDFDAALDAALADRKKPSIIECNIAAEQILPGKRLSEL